MSQLWYVIRIVGGLTIRIEPGHVEECDAYAHLATLASEDDAYATDIEYTVESRSTHPTAYCMPRQRG